MVWSIDDILEANKCHIKNNLNFSKNKATFCKDFRDVYLSLYAASVTLH